jgi:hypothetical protein
MNETVEVNHYWSLEHTVSRSFNRLKAKLFSLIEASSDSSEQVDALKNLVRGFANDEYRLCIEDMRAMAKVAKFIPENDQSLPIAAEPLETYTL